MIEGLENELKSVFEGFPELYAPSNSKKMQKLTQARAQLTASNQNEVNQRFLAEQLQKSKRDE